MSYVYPPNNKLVSIAASSVTSMFAATSIATAAITALVAAHTPLPVTVIPGTLACSVNGVETTGVILSYNVSIMCQYVLP